MPQANPPVSRSMGTNFDRTLVIFGLLMVAAIVSKLYT
jgi:hypothetical protein